MDLEELATFLRASVRNSFDDDLNVPMGGI